MNIFNGKIKNSPVSECSNSNNAKIESSADSCNKSKANIKSKTASTKRLKSYKRCFGLVDFFQTSWKLFKEFSADTSIHGIKYLTDQQRNWSEKVFWSIALILSIIACSYCIYLSWRKFVDSPLIFSFAPKPMNIWDIPFCAVTICPTGTLVSINQTSFQPDSSVANVISKNFTGNLEQRITHVKWRQEDYNSNKLFTEIMTHEGFCYTFNMMNFYDLFEGDVVFECFDNLKDEMKIQKASWDLQEGYRNREAEAFPFRILGSGENGGLKFQIWRKITEVKKIKNPVKGFKVAVHLPCEIPQFDQQYYRLPLEKAATLLVRPSMTVTEGLDGYSTDARQCFVEGEKKLIYFKKYTRANCLLECLVNYTLEHCGCVHFSLPRMSGDKVCNSSMEECFLKAKKTLAYQKMKDGLDAINGQSIEESSCKCLPSCTSLFYEGEISQDDIRYFSRSERTNDAYKSVLSIMFRDDDFLYTQRSEIHGWADFIANFGGLLGLFLGVSILSIVEIIYFISFRKLNEDNTFTSLSNATLKSCRERIESGSTLNGLSLTQANKI